MPCTPSSGACDKCQSACSHKPGWFAPGEAERVAVWLELPLQELFDTKLAVDWLVGDELPTKEDGTRYPNIFVLSPATTNNDPGEEFPGDPRGTCVFLEKGKCSIHPVKPKECATWWCGYEHGPGMTLHNEIGLEWQESQPQIEELLGREPHASEFMSSIWDMLGD